MLLQIEILFTLHDYYMLSSSPCQGDRAADGEKPERRELVDDRPGQKAQDHHVKKSGGYISQRLRTVKRPALTPSPLLVYDRFSLEEEVR
jgi:hypothetical protein